MNTLKLKSLINSANSTLKTQPLALLSANTSMPHDRSYSNSINLRQSSKQSPEQLLSSLRCYACSDVRRQNYQLKQQLCQIQQKYDKMGDLEKQMSAIRQLYQLKCKQVELVRKQLEQAKNKIDQMQNKSKQFCQYSMQTISRKLKEIKELEGGSMNYI